MAGIKISIEFDDLPEPQIDEADIALWVEARLNDARNMFIEQVSRGAGGGKTYRRSRGRIVHQASEAGEYPVTDKGGLVGSIYYQMHGFSEGSLYSNLEYAKFLADPGTRYIAPRKMLDEAIKEVLENRPSADVLARAAKIK